MDGRKESGIEADCHDQVTTINPHLMCVWLPIAFSRANSLGVERHN